MVVLNLSPEPIWRNTMLKFESPKTNLKGKSSSLYEKQLKNPKVKKKRFPSFLTPEKKEKITLPVPTVPPYPIEFFQRESPTCHTNRAFECTEEYLLTHNLVPNKEDKHKGNDEEKIKHQTPSSKTSKAAATKEQNHSCANVSKSKVKDRSAKDVKREVAVGFDVKPCGKPASFPSDSRSITQNAHAVPISIHDSFRNPLSLKYINTVGIPVQNTHVNQKRFNATGSFKYPSETSRLALVPMPNIIYGSTRRKKQPYRLKLQPGHSSSSNFQSIGPITNGTLKAKTDTLQRPVRKTGPHSRHGSSDSECFPYGGPPPYPGLTFPKKKISFHTMSMRSPLSSSQVFFPGGTLQQRLQQPNENSQQMKLLPRQHKRYNSTLERSQNNKYSPIKVYADSKEILISSLSPPPRLPVKLPQEYVQQGENTTPGKHDSSYQKNIPIYSKVFKPKKQKIGTPNKKLNSKGSDELGLSKNSVVKKSTSASSSEHENQSVPSQSSGGDAEKLSKGKLSNGRIPSYEDIVDFQDDNEQREFNVEVRIDYSKGNKYRMWTKHTLNKRKNKDSNVAATDLNANQQKDQGSGESQKLNSKLKEISELKSFKLGVVRIVRVGKWRFVALCCCGNTKRYVHQPGRIENYVPGFSSLSEKELRDNPEADVKLEIKTKEAAPLPSFQSVQRPGSGRMQMSHALKESGYESDSTLVFRKREDQRRRYLDPKDSSLVYKQVQQGGEIPLTGLQKPAPPRPKEPVIGTLQYPPYQRHYGEPSYTDSGYKYNSSEVNIHYRTPVRFEQKESLSEEELARRQEEHMKKVYEQERRKKYLSELEDIERRRHTDNFTPLQKSPIPLNRYDDESLGPLAKTPEPRQLARALFSFGAQNKRELSFNKGDIVTIRRTIDRNWYEGEMKGVVGIFPCNYVEVISADSLKTLGRKPSEGQARSRFNFQAQTAMEMSLTKGELVILTRRVDENWYEGRVGNRKGIFPVTYVDVLMEPGGDRATSPSRDPIPRPALPAAHLLYNGTSGVSSPYSSMGRTGSQTDKSFTQLTVNTQQDPIPYRALYNYKPQNEDELELLEGDTVLVMEKCDDGWFVGTSKRTGLFGTFPGNYVERS